MYKIEIKKLQSLKKSQIHKVIWQDVKWFINSHIICPSMCLSTLLLKASILGTDILIREAMMYVSAPLFIRLGIICLAQR